MAQKHTDETRIFLFVGKVKDLANRNGQEPVLVAIGFVYVILFDLLEVFGAAIGQLRSGVHNIRTREDDKP
jgi:hypothetical protein